MIFVTRLEKLSPRLKSAKRLPVQQQNRAWSPILPPGIFAAPARSAFKPIYTRHADRGQRDEQSPGDAPRRGRSALSSYDRRSFDKC